MLSSGKERDEMLLDYFGARYYSAAQGRFTGSDPALKGSADIGVEIQHKDPFLSGPGRDRGCTGRTE